MMSDAQMKVYKPDGATLREFLRNRTARFLCLQGPEGSGKSTASAMKLWMVATLQEPAADGWKRTRLLVVRNTFNDLKLTTVQTWKALFPPEEYGQFLDTAPFQHRIRLPQYKIECDVWFVSMDKEEDVKKALSLEVTAIWVNEGRELARRLVGALYRRLGRYPRMEDGGPTYPVMVLDTNAPADDHWIPIMRGDVPVPSGLSDEEKLELVKPEGWDFYNQPGGLIEVVDEAGNHVRFEPNPAAENTKFLEPGYYMTAAKGQSIHDVRIALCNMLGRSRVGKPVWPMFKPDLHAAKKELLPVEGHPLLVGVDFGLTPAAVIGQHVNGRWLILDELVADDDAGMGAITFAPLLKAHIAGRFPGFQISMYGDPAGDQRAQSDERSPFMIFRAQGLAILPTNTNDFVVRKEAVEMELNRLANGYPAFLLSARCVKLKAAMEFGYRFRKMKMGGADRYADRPEKDEHSHVADALQYLLLGGGAGRTLLVGSAVPAGPVQTKRQGYNPLGGKQVMRMGVRGWNG